MTGLRVSELARRGGVPPSTVRFYERRGVLSPARRGANGYRVFDESAVDQLRFVTRAKGIGLSLPEIAALGVAWAAGECRPLQGRLRDVLARRSGRVCRQLAELAAAQRRTEAALARLDVHGDGPAQCGPGCACDAALDAGAGSRAEPACSPGAEQPGLVACSLSPGELTARSGEWRSVAAAATSARRDDGMVRLTLPADPATVAAAAGVCAAEIACCPGTNFRLDISAGQVTLTVRAPGVPTLLDLLAPVTFR